MSLSEKSREYTFLKQNTMSIVWYFKESFPIAYCGFPILCTKGMDC